MPDFYEDSIANGAASNTKKNLKTSNIPVKTKCIIIDTEQKPYTTNNCAIRFKHLIGLTCPLGPTRQCPTRSLWVSTRTNKESLKSMT
jgi:hypothetical protein